MFKKSLVLCIAIFIGKIYCQPCDYFDEEGKILFFWVSALQTVLVEYNLTDWYISMPLERGDIGETSTHQPCH